jgi:hypothetical protein
LAAATFSLSRMHSACRRWLHDKKVVRVELHRSCE